MSVRVLSVEGDEFIVPSWCFVIGSTATSALHTVCAKAAVHSSAPIVRLSQPLPQLRIAMGFMVEGTLPAPAELSMAQWLELHRTSALLHYPTLRDAVESALLSLSRDRGAQQGHLVGHLGGHLGGQATPNFAVGAAPGEAAAGGGLTAADYVSKSWQGLYTPAAAGSTALGATTGAFSLAASMTGGFRAAPAGGSVAASAQSTMLPDPFGFTRRGGI